MGKNDYIDYERRAFITGRWKAKPGISADCLNNQGIYCQACKDVCDEAAIEFKLAKMGVRIPMLDTDRCTGCKECLESCPAGAITVTSRKSVIHE